MVSLQFAVATPDGGTHLFRPREREGFVLGKSKRVVCVLCEVDGPASREDVIPKWVLKCYENPDAAPFTTWRNGEPVTRRDGLTAVSHPTLNRVLLDVCAACNKWLNRSFEVPAKRPVRQLAAGQDVFDSDVRAVGRWVAKTLVLYGHPNTRSGFDGNGAFAQQVVAGASELAKEIRLTGEIPAGVSVWAAVIDESARSTDFDVPTQFLGGGVGVVNVGFGLHDLGLMVRLNLVVHPSLSLENPWEEAGFATRLWPDPPSALSVVSAPKLDTSAGRRFADWMGLEVA